MRICHRAGTSVWRYRIPGAEWGKGPCGGLSILSSRQSSQDEAWVWRPFWESFADTAALSRFAATSAEVRRLRFTSPHRKSRFRMWRKILGGAKSGEPAVRFLSLTMKMAFVWLPRWPWRNAGSPSLQRLADGKAWRYFASML